MRDPARDFVLYLRSFRDDALRGDSIDAAFPKRRLLRLLFGIGESFGVRPEERLVIVAHGVGHMVALGRPGDTLPEIGAARIYIEQTADDEEWRSTVTDLCGRARLVLLQMGATTPGLLWEIQQVKRILDPERLILYFPRGMEAGREESFRAVYDRYFPKPLTSGSISAGCVIFDREWHPSLIGPWSLPIRSAPGILNEDHGLFLKPTELGLDEDTISLLSAIEQNFPRYNTPIEAKLPFDLQVHRSFDVLRGPLGKLGGALGCS